MGSGEKLGNLNFLGTLEMCQKNLEFKPLDSEGLDALAGSNLFLRDPHSLNPSKLIVAKVE